MKISRFFLQLMLCFRSWFLGYESGSKIKPRTLICIWIFVFVLIAVKIDLKSDLIAVKIKALKLNCFFSFFDLCFF